uniref:phage terminase small subunit n=1 Tax=Corynebacterium durum TaxID=61592 RepID=UPI00288A59AA|nr:hypothetical protein [Corynebacterium durum]
MSKLTVPQPPLRVVDPHPMVVDLWEALGRSVQAQIYEPSDWALAQVAAEATNQLLNAPRMSAQLLKEVNALWGDLMVSEASRRRVGMLRVPEQEAQETVQIKDYLLKAFELDRGANGNY